MKNKRKKENWKEKMTFEILLEKNIKKRRKERKYYDGKER